MPYFDDKYECDDCGRDIETAFYFRDDGDSKWKYTADEHPNEPDHIKCGSCYRRDQRAGKE